MSWSNTFVYNYEISLTDIEPEFGGAVSCSFFETLWKAYIYRFDELAEYTVNFFFTPNPYHVELITLILINIILYIYRTLARQYVNVTF